MRHIRRKETWPRFSGAIDERARATTYRPYRRYRPVRGALGNTVQFRLELADLTSGAETLASPRQPVRLVRSVVPLGSRRPHEPES